MTITVGFEAGTKNAVFIDDLDKENQRGLRCGCVCPECGSLLVARLGEINSNHFAHYKSKETSNCQMTALHLLGQLVLSRQSEISIKEYRVMCDYQYDILRRRYEADEIKLFKDVPIKIESTELERTIETIRSDVFTNSIYKNINLQINFEIKVWHGVDDVKIEKVKSLKLNTIEIDLFHLINEQNITYEMIVEELNDPFNQSIVHLDEQFITACKLQVEEHLQVRIEKENSKVNSWLKYISRQLSSNGIQLPIYNYRLKDIPDNISINSDIFPTKPNFNRLLDVISFDCNSGGYLEIIVNISGVNKSLPVLPTSVDVNTLTILDASYLIINDEHIGKDLGEIEFKWGVNKAATNYQDLYNKIISDEISLRNKRISNEKKRELYKIKRLLLSVEKIKEKKQYVRSKVYERIVEKANYDYKDLVKKGYPPKGIENLVNKELDQLQIFGCEAKYWQIILIRDICWVNNCTVNISFLAKRLENYHVTLVPPFSNLIYQSKLMKANGIIMPFDNIYKILSEFIFHLKCHRFIGYEDGNNIKMFPYGDSYKNQKNQEIPIFQNCLS